MSQTFPHIVPSGIDIIAYISGVNNIGTSGTAFSGVYADNYWNNKPSFAFISSSGLATAQPNDATKFFVMSGSAFSTVSGSNFTIITGNPHQVTYIGPNTIFALANLSASFTTSTNNTNPFIAISKNGGLTLAGNLYQNYSNMFATSATNNATSLSVNAVYPMVSGDFLQATTHTNQVGTQVGNFQMVVTKII